MNEDVGNIFFFWLEDIPLCLKYNDKIKSCSGKFAETITTVRNILYIRSCSGMCAKTIQTVRNIQSIRSYSGTCAETIPTLSNTQCVRSVAET